MQNESIKKDNSAIEFQSQNVNNEINYEFAIKTLS